MKREPLQGCFITVHFFNMFAWLSSLYGGLTYSQMLVENQLAAWIDGISFLDLGFAKYVTSVLLAFPLGLLFLLIPSRWTRMRVSDLYVPLINCKARLYVCSRIVGDKFRL